MNFTESFDQFASKLTTMDLALYAGVGLVIWVLFKDQLSPVQKLVLGFAESVKKLWGQTTNNPSPSVVVDVPVVDTKRKNKTQEEDIFFNLVVSWKQTRDLAVRSGCVEAIKVADQMFPYLSPSVCSNKEDKAL